MKYLKIMPILLLLLFYIVRASVSVAASKCNELDSNENSPSDRKGSWEDNESINYVEKIDEDRYNNYSNDYDHYVKYLESSIDSRISDENNLVHYKPISFFEDEEYGEIDKMIGGYGDHSESKTGIYVSLINPSHRQQESTDEIPIKSVRPKRFSCYNCNYCNIC